MTVLSLRPTRSPAFELLQRELRLPYGDDFSTARKLIALIEAAAPLLDEVDRLQLGRLMTASGHAIGLSCRRAAE